jgi:endonuclease YncB( thermonuclease family)
MSYHDYFFRERLMHLRIEEELRQAELRRLQNQARGGHRGWPSRQGGRILAQVGSLFVSLGAWMVQAGSPQLASREPRAKRSVPGLS